MRRPPRPGRTWTRRGPPSRRKVRTRRRRRRSMSFRRSSIRRARNRSCRMSCARTIVRPSCPRKDWFTWPANIFDNLYFIGTKTAGVWAINTPEGIIVIDANFHYSSKELVLGLLNFGLDPNNIKYIIITHAHDDRYWGAKASSGHVSECAHRDVGCRLGPRGEGQLTGRIQAAEGHGRHRWSENHARWRDGHCCTSPLATRPGRCH